MTEQEKKLGDKFAAYSILPKAEQRGFLIAYRLLEDEIDELTKSRDDWKFSTEEFRKRFLYKCDEKAELTKEAERLRKEKQFIYECWMKSHKSSYWWSEKQNASIIMAGQTNRVYFEGKEYSECKPIECGFSNWDDAILLGTK